MSSIRPTDGHLYELHPCPKGDGCALNDGAIKCKHCGRNWPPDETWRATEPKGTGRS